MSRGLSQLCLPQEEEEGGRDGEEEEESVPKILTGDPIASTSRCNLSPQEEEEQRQRKKERRETADDPSLLGEKENRSLGQWRVEGCGRSGQAKRYSEPPFFLPPCLQKEVSRAGRSSNVSKRMGTDLA